MTLKVGRSPNYQKLIQEKMCRSPLKRGIGGALRSHRLIVSALVAVLGFAGLKSAVAAPITSLFNTGVATNNPVTGAPLTFTADNVADGHYSITAAPSPNVAGPAVVTKSNQFPISTGDWHANTATAKWVSPHGDESIGHNEPQGAYIYRTTFDLTGFIPSSASISGSVMEDNNLTDIKINGLSLNVTALQGFLVPKAFSINNGFVPGTNTIDFLVQNLNSKTGNAQGLFVDMSGTATPAPSPVVPEPASVGMIGLAGVALLGRRGKRDSR